MNLYNNTDIKFGKSIIITAIIAYMPNEVLMMLIQLPVLFIRSDRAPPTMGIDVPTTYYTVLLATVSRWEAIRICTETIAQNKVIAAFIIHIAHFLICSQNAASLT